MQAPEVMAAPVVREVAAVLAALVALGAHNLQSLVRDSTESLDQRLGM